MVNKVITWVLIMALFVSQSYAYAFAPCESNAHSTGQYNADAPQSLAPQSLDPMTHSMPDHMQHNMLQNSQQQEPAMDCCDQDCSCLTGACASVTLTHFNSATALTLVSNAAGFYLFSIQETLLPSLRKPPITG